MNKNKDLPYIYQIEKEENRYKEMLDIPKGIQDMRDKITSYQMALKGALESETALVVSGEKYRGVGTTSTIIKHAAESGLPVLFENQRRASFFSDLAVDKGYVAGTTVLSRDTSLGYYVVRLSDLSDPLPKVDEYTKTYLSDMLPIKSYLKASKEYGINIIGTVYK